MEVGCVKVVFVGVVILGGGDRAVWTEACCLYQRKRHRYFSCLLQSQHHYLTPNSESHADRVSITGRKKKEGEVTDAIFPFARFSL